MHVGQTVQHPTFGVGIICTLTPYRVGVLFDSAGERVLVPELARLRVVPAKTTNPRAIPDRVERGLQQRREARSSALRYWITCQVCGRGWRSPVTHPQRCFHCRSPYWNGRPQGAPQQHQHHCHVCGYDWTGYVAQPTSCARCGHLRWDDANYVKRVPQRCKCGVMTRAAQRKAHHVCDPDWRRRPKKKQVEQ